MKALSRWRRRRRLCAPSDESDPSLHPLSSALRSLVDADRVQQAGDLEGSQVSELAKVVAKPAHAVESVSAADRLVDARFNPTTQIACPERGGRPELGSPAMFVRPNTLHRHLRDALKACGLPALSWYHATRHTFASQWVMGGHNIAKLQAILGHSSIVTTQRYAHLGRNLFDASELNALAVDLSRPAGTVLPIAESRPNLTPPTASETSEALAFQG